MRVIAEDEEKKQQELTEQERREKEEIVLSLFADLIKEDTPEEAFVRERVETTNPSSWRYGYKMFLCIPHHTEKERAWQVTMTKRGDQKSTHINFYLLEWPENTYFFVPYSKRTHYDLEAMEEIDTLLKHNPKEATFYAMKADKLAELGNDQEALEWYDKAIALSPEALTYCRKGHIFSRLEKPGEAMECYEKAITVEPDKILGYDCKAHLLEELGRREEAITLYDSFIATYPTNLHGYVQKAFFYISLGKYDEAQAIHKQGTLHT